MARRLTAAVLCLALATGCAAPRVVRLDTGQGAPLEYRPPASSRPVKVDAAAFEAALAQWVLNAPLPLRSPRQGGVVHASYGSDAESRRQRLLGKSFGGVCGAGQRRADCLSLLDDVMGLDERGKLGVALGLSLDPLKESISKAVEKTLAPQLFYTIIATGFISWVVLAANPEPVFTKAAALISALMLIYLGVETFLEVVDASRELKRNTDKATTLEDLAQAGQRFANRLGPEVARVFVLAVTVAVSSAMTGGSAWLASRLSVLPNFPQAEVVGASQAGFSVGSVGEVSSVVVVGDTVVISLPATAVAMVAQGPGDGEEDDGCATGQQHHVISKRIARKLRDHRTLRGHYTERDPRFVTRAADKASHNGYQQWHRDIDKEVIKWLDRYQDATPEEFEAFLRELYSRPDMRARFPNGF